MSKLDEIKRSYENTESLFEASEMWLKRRYGIPSWLATAIDLVVLLACALGAWFFYHSAPIVKWAPIALFAYIGVITVAGLVRRFRTGSA